MSTSAIQGCSVYFLLVYASSGDTLYHEMLGDAQCRPNKSQSDWGPLVMTSGCRTGDRTQFRPTSSNEEALTLDQRQIKLHRFVTYHKEVCLFAPFQVCYPSLLYGSPVVALVISPERPRQTTISMRKRISQVFWSTWWMSASTTSSLLGMVYDMFPDGIGAMTEDFDST